MILSCVPVLPPLGTSHLTPVAINCHAATGIKAAATEGAALSGGTFKPGMPTVDSFVHSFFSIAQLGQFARAGLSILARWSLSGLLGIGRSAVYDPSQVAHPRPNPAPTPQPIPSHSLPVITCDHLPTHRHLAPFCRWLRTTGFIFCTIRQWGALCST